MSKKIKSIKFFSDRKNKKTKYWEKKIKEEFPGLVVNNKDYEGIIALGGDGTVLKAARESYKDKVPVLGLKLGMFGFLTAERDPKNFLSTTKKFLNGKYKTFNQKILSVSVVRNGKSMRPKYAVNDVLIQNFLGMVQLEVFLGDYSFQTIRGTGVLVSTPLGSTALNLSAHGPVVTPENKSLIVTEILDHNIPTPSLVLHENTEVSIKVKDFRRHETISITENGKAFDVALVTDGKLVSTIKKGDEIKIKAGPKTVKLAITDPDHFLKSLNSKFLFG